MRILIEEHQYEAAAVKDVLEGIDALENVNGLVSLNYVGYFYNTRLQDCVFILPKVLLEDKDHQELVFGRYKPEDIINIDSHNPLTQQERDFIYEFSVWIYRAICVFRNDKDTDSSIVYHKKIIEAGRGHRKLTNTFLDILLALIQFNKDNQNFFFFVLRNLHSGFNKINWTKTIAHTQAVVQDNTAVYINPVNKRRQINFDEELLVIFFSILNYIGDHYGFAKNINVNFSLITGKQFENYLKGYGKTRLLQIKYKYFSDKALKLWNLCFAFFDSARQVRTNAQQKEYLLVKNFNIVFEAIIDNLVGDPRSEIPAGLKDQDDGKRIDHLYTYQSLTTRGEDKPVYYIGDSKYYKRGNEVGRNSVYKQFTYARNVIQWNLDLFLDENSNDEDWKADKKKFGSSIGKLRDEQTEGYNIIPNFFISATLDKDLSYKDDIRLTEKNNKCFSSSQFKNRLFDRDTLLICHYDVNFLYVVALYARNNHLQKAAWKEKVRRMFRDQIQKMLEEQYDFYAITAKEGVSAVSYIEDHFQQLLGKIFTPYPDRGMQKYYSVALDNNPEYAEENASLLAQLESSFYVAKCVDANGDTQMDKDPKTLLPEVEPMAVYANPGNFLTYHYLEKYADKQILIGCYHDQAHLDWILGKNDRGTLIYNIRLGKNRQGGQSELSMNKRTVSFVVLYEYGKESENRYRVFRVHHHAVMTKDRIIRAWYPSTPHSDKYFCYVFDEEVSLGKLELNKLISEERISQMGNFVDGAPIFKTGEEMLKYRR